MRLLARSLGYAGMHEALCLSQTGKELTRDLVFLPHTIQFCSIMPRKNARFLRT